MAKSWFEYLNPNEYKLWNEFVEASPQGSLYAKTWYLDAIGCPYRVGIVRNEKIIQAGIVLTKSELKCYSNPLFVKYLGILFRELGGKDETRVTREKEWIEIIVKGIRRIKTFDYAFHPNFTNWMPFYWKGYRESTKYTYILENLEDIDKVYSGFRDSLRNVIRRAQKYDFDIRSDIDPDRFYHLNRVAFEKGRAKIPYSFKKFQGIYDKLKKRDAIKLFGVLDAGDNLHSIAGVVYDSKSCNLLFNATDKEFIEDGSNSLLIFETIKFASGISRIYDFEGSMIKSIERFYRSFGGRQVRYFNIWRNNMLNVFKRNSLRVLKGIFYGR